ncbi:heat shock protein DnaJ domain protein [Halorubrum aidingense JCM 13560]|uniref:Heat shock protein DnaJ domain protein n=1 Tax=Halorubrum aidingense JCM 13560 TaxID=1230454 RepID=M0PAD6_9EURY|nr:DnaJ domain-containing protein [Halorubrum aidingense]EMA66981.1 heat shock protein DnaJ domain protein [Halorubrum aidingense JCM 13560]
MTNRAIIVGLAATFIGLTALLAVAGVVVSPVLLILAVPFGVVAYFLWYHASGRLRDRVRREAARAGPAEHRRARQRARAAEHRRSAHRSAGAGGGATDGGFGASGAAGGFGGRDPRGSRDPRDPRDRAPSTSGMTEREAYETLGLDRTAGQDAIRSTYREQAKRLHPDGEDGDEAAFKELTEAYDLLKR